MSVAFIRVRPRGYFAHVSITTPVVSALKNYYIESFLEVPTDFLKYFWIQVAVSEVKTVVTKPFRKCNGYKFITAICNSHSPMEKSVRSGVTVM
jgi:hypothetical protein